MPKIMNSTSIGNTKRDNTRVVSKQPIKIKLTPEQIAALEKEQYEELLNKNKGTLTDLGGKPSTDTRSSAKRNADYLHPIKKEIMDLSDVMVDGPFILALRDPDLAFRGSSNQRIINLK